MFLSTAVTQNKFVVLVVGSQRSRGVDWLAENVVRDALQFTVMKIRVHKQNKVYDFGNFRFNSFFLPPLNADYIREHEKCQPNGSC